MTADADWPRRLPRGFREYWLPSRAGWLRLVAGGWGHPLFLVHGLGGSAEDFYDLAPLLARRRMCLMPDLPGFGRSQKPDASYTIEWFVSVVAELARELTPGPSDWVGHSMGGQIALWLGREHPGLVRRLVAVCPAGGQPGPDRLQRLLFSLLTSHDRLRLYHPWLLGQGAAYVFGQPPWGPPSWPGFAAFRRRLLAQWAGPERPRREMAFIRSARGVLAQPLAGRLGGLEPPVLLVEGHGDNVTSAWQTQRLWESLPPGNGRARLPGGHMPPYRDPAGLAQKVLDFLDAGVDSRTAADYTTNTPA